jgi:hypothetical protein
MTVPDLARATTETKRRVERVIVTLNAVVQQRAAVFGSPRDVMIDLILREEELHAAARVMKLAWWP